MKKEELLQYLIDRRESARYAGLDDIGIGLMHIEVMIHTLLAITWNDTTEPVGTD